MIEFGEAKREQENLERWRIIQARILEIRVQKAFALFRSYQLEPILIKGWSVARFYPRAALRLSGDIDLAIRREDLATAKKILETAEGTALGIDLHDGIRHLGSLRWEEVFARSEMVNCGGETVRVLSAEDNLSVICVHWLTDGGEYRERLWDIFHLISHRPPEFDWEKCLHSLEPQRRTWVLTAIALTHWLLGLNIEDLPFGSDICRDDYLPAWIVSTVLREWQNPVKLVNLSNSRRDKRLFWKQLKKRGRPNPISAAIELNMKFAEIPRLFLLTAYNMKRLWLLLERIWRANRRI